MNVFHRYTRRSLRLSPARTLVTVIGIVLSMSLFTAVIEGAYSGLQYLIRGEVEVSGANSAWGPFSELHFYTPLGAGGCRGSAPASADGV